MIFLAKLHFVFKKNPALSETMCRAVVVVQRKLFGSYTFGSSMKFDREVQRVVRCFNSNTLHKLQGTVLCSRKLYELMALSLWIMQVWRLGDWANIVQGGMNSGN